MQGVLVLFLKTTNKSSGKISKSDREIPQLSGVFQRMDAEGKRLEQKQKRRQE